MSLDSRELWDNIQQLDYEDLEMLLYNAVRKMHEHIGMRRTAEQFAQTIKKNIERK